MDTCTSIHCWYVTLCNNFFNSLLTNMFLSHCIINAGCSPSDTPSGLPVHYLQLPSTILCARQPGVILLNNDGAGYCSSYWNYFTYSSSGSDTQGLFSH